VQIRIGYELIYQSPQPTPMILNLQVHYTRAADLVRADQMLTDPWVPLTLYRDGFGNWCTRLVAPPGQIRISADAVIHDRGLPESVMPNAPQSAWSDFRRKRWSTCSAAVIAIPTAVRVRLEPIWCNHTGLAPRAGGVRFRPWASDFRLPVRASHADGLRGLPGAEGSLSRLRPPGDYACAVA
jgi:hypothetical protein